MPEYTFECCKCKASTSYIWGIKEYDDNFKKLKCPKCKSKKLVRDYDSDGVAVRCKNVDTIGKLADKNTKKYKSRIMEAEAKRKESKKPIKKPWYQTCGDATRKEINKMTEKQKTHYIQTGEKP